MTVLLKIAILFLKIIYFFIKLFPTKNKITMISRQQDKTTMDFELLKEKIEEKGKYKVVILAKKLKPGIKNKILYIFHMFSQMYALATSKVVILDSYCITASVLNHKKTLTIIQMWHAMGSLKKFGLSGLNNNSKSSALRKEMNTEKKKKIAKIMCMHKNYDYFFVSSKHAIPYFAEAFGTEKEKAVVMPLPIVDLLTDENYKKEKAKEIKNTYPQMKKKKNIVFVPTYREQEQKEKIKELIDQIDFNKYNFIVKLHPLTTLNDIDQRVIVDNKYQSRDMMIIADYIITDYSAIVYEASLLKKPIYFYIYDFDSYSKNRDFYTDFKKELPGKMSKNPKDIINWIENDDYDLTKVEDFSKKYIELSKESACQKITDFIYEIIDSKTK